MSSRWVSKMAFIVKEMEMSLKAKEREMEGDEGRRRWSCEGVRGLSPFRTLRMNQRETYEGSQGPATRHPIQFGRPINPKDEEPLLSRRRYPSVFLSASILKFLSSKRFLTIIKWINWNKKNFRINLMDNRIFTKLLIKRRFYIL